MKWLVRCGVVYLLGLSLPPVKVKDCRMDSRSLQNLAPIPLRWNWCMDVDIVGWPINCFIEN